MKKSLALTAACALVAAAAYAQSPEDPIGALLGQSTSPAAQAAAPYVPGALADSDASGLRSALAAARAGDRGRFQSAYESIADLDARKLAVWAMVDASGEQLSFGEIDQARASLAGWPRAARRQTLAEKKLEGGGLGPQDLIAWFGGQAPTTVEGAMALASALVMQGREDEARRLIRGFWRDRMFEADAQRAMLARFGSWFDEADHIKRLDTLLLGPQGPAAQAIMPLVPAEVQQLAQARIALRAGRADGLSRAAALPDSVANDPGLALEKARYLRTKDQESQGYELLRNWPQAPAHDDGAQRIYAESRQYFVSALADRNWRAAYEAMADHGYPGGERKAESDFFAGWVALTKLNDPATAARHFEGVRQAGRTPLTQGRALYWLGRAAEAQGQTAVAQSYYLQGAQFVGAFYGQLSAEKAGYKTITLPAEPVVTDADRAAFEGRDVVRAIRILNQIGETALFKAFVTDLDDGLTRPQDFAQLIDLSRNAGESFMAMMVGRAAAGKGVILPERMYPLVVPPQPAGAPDPAFILAIMRQESSFDPRARSPADARGMMMLMPSTARIVARQMGVPYVESRLWEADYNMQLGTFELGQRMNAVSGSYILTAAGYNAGPARPSQWLGRCGDPRAAFTDPVDFIECVPFGETRDYMMRVMENLQVYRARLAGGTGPLTISADLKRGATTYTATAAAAPVPDIAAEPSAQPAVGATP